MLVLDQNLVKHETNKQKSLNYCLKIFFCVSKLEFVEELYILSFINLPHALKMHVV